MPTSSATINHLNSSKLKKLEFGCFAQMVEAPQPRNYRRHFGWHN